ncbi:MAG: portal protein [Negativicutes bacterium]|nr:portal protein [Negativicutes bacterium]
MADNPISYDTRANALQSSHEEALIGRVLQMFAQLQTYRNVFASHWEEVAELVLPTSRNTFFYGNYNWPGQKKTDRQVDATGMMALSRFAAICDSLLTPRNSKWHGLGANNPYVMKDRASRLWFEQATDILFKYRYSTVANFSSQNLSNFQSLGAFGNGGMFIDEFDGTNGIIGMRYKAIPLGELFIRENHQGLIDSFIRWFRLTARQAFQKWPAAAEAGKLAYLQASLDASSEQLFDFLHCVEPNEDYDPTRLDRKGKPFASTYVAVQGKCLLGEGGYRTFPLAPSRYDQTPGETYGRGPAMMVLPALKTLNAEKRTFLKAGHRAADPVLLTADDGMVDFNMRPGALNKGGMSPDGRPLVGTLPAGNIQITAEMMQEERSLINDAFLVTLFQILTDTPQMTATEVIERTNEKGILLAPTVGRQQSEYLGPMIDRELDILSHMGLLPPMPPRLKEAHGEYEVVYTSPMAKAMRAQEAAGFMRTLSSVQDLVQITQDPSLLDPFDFDVAIPKIADIQGVPESWMANSQAIQAKRQNRAKQQQVQQQIQAAPAQAAMMKAQAIQQKAGMTPPQQQQGQPQQGQPGQPGQQPQQQQPAQAGIPGG